MFGISLNEEGAGIKMLRNIIEPYMRYRSLIIGLKRNDYQKLQIIADDLNEHVQGEYEFTPELILHES
jgi:hypothetical protein